METRIETLQRELDTLRSELRTAVGRAYEDRAAAYVETHRKLRQAQAEAGEE
jgi:hypothetical protein